MVKIFSRYAIFKNKPQLARIPTIFANMGQFVYVVAKIAEMDDKTAVSGFNSTKVPPRLTFSICDALAKPLSI